MRVVISVGLLLAALCAAPARVAAQSAPAPGQPAEPAPAAVAAPATGPADQAAARGANRYLLVEEFTADTLAAGEVQVGTDLAVGLTERLMIGTDLESALVGAATVEAKLDAWRIGEHQIALGLRAAYLNKNTLSAWGSLKDHYDQLDARVLRPSVAWTNTLSPRLKLHTFWAKGFGPVDARLNASGKRALWEKKHPGQDYDQRDPVSQQPTAGKGPAANQEKASGNRASPTQQTVDVQSIAGLAQDRFQLTSEYTRANGNKVLVTSRIEQTSFEQLKSSFFRLTVAHQWVWPSFQIRLGIGLQYLVMTGHDLDDESINQAGWQPASDIAFYWRF